MRRMWINQPSASQPHHKLHGTRVLAESPNRTSQLTGKTLVFYTSGPEFFDFIANEALSHSWPDTESRKFKIIGTDNFNREHVSDYVIAENIRSEWHARVMADAWNTEYSGEDAPTYARVIPQNKELYIYEI